VQKLYITVAVFFLICILLFISSFIYLDKSKHRIYLYTITVDGHEAGTVKIDRYETEDNIIYKSYSDMPFEHVVSQAKTKIVLDPKYNFQAYEKETYGNGMKELYLLEKRKDGAAFLAKFRICFSYLDDVPLPHGTFIFEEGSPLTYLPLLENYNFRKGRAQGFSGLVVHSPDLPPMKKLITLTSIKDEYLKIDSRNLKAENLLIKIRNFPQGSIWVAKSDRSLLRLEILNSKLAITRNFKPTTNKLEPKKLDLGGDEYAVQEAAFTSKNVKLAGTMTFPKEGGPFPAVLMIAPIGPSDREYYGLFTTMADYLSRNGFCVLRFDKRGAGQSSGDASSHTFNDEFEDLGSAFDYLASQKEVDPQRIALISHSNGAYHALRLGAERDMVKTAVLMSPSLSLDCGNDDPIARLKDASSKYMWRDDYLQLAIKAVRETAEKVKDARHNWTFLSGNICFVKNLKEAMAEKPMDILKAVKIPVLLLQGKGDEEALSDDASVIDKALGGAGDQEHLLRYYGYLGYFLGQKVNDGVHKSYYGADKEVLNSINAWLQTKLEIKK